MLDSAFFSLLEEYPRQQHMEEDRVARVRLAQLPRTAGEKHPYETDVATVQRYFEMTGACAEAQRLSLQ